MGFLLYILLLLVIIICVSLLRVRFDVEYHRREQNDNLMVKMSLLRGLINYKTEVPVIELEQRFFAPVLKMVSELDKVPFAPEEDKQLKVGMPITFRSLRSLPAMLKAGWQRFEQYNSALHYFFRFVRCLRFHWRTEVGLDDAAYTGIVVGIIWGVKSFLYKNFRSKIGFMSERPAIEVVPDFFHKRLALDFNCIFDIRIGHIIIAGLNFVRNALIRQ